MNKTVDFVGTLVVPEIKGPFIAREKFIIDTSQNAKVKISCLGGWFKEKFLGKIEENFIGSTLRYGNLKKYSNDDQIIAEMGGKAILSETTLIELFASIERQYDGQEGALLVDGSSNMFYIRDVKFFLFPVRVGWSRDGWGIGASDFPRGEYACRFNSPQRVFCRALN